MERRLFRIRHECLLLIELIKVDPESDTIEMQIENDILKIKKVEKDNESINPKG